MPSSHYDKSQHCLVSGAEESEFSQIATYGVSTSSTDLGLRLLPGLGALSARLSQTMTAQR